MNRCLIAVVASLFFVATGPAIAAPNLLLVTLDTTRADHLGCYGASSGATPNLDRFAAGGVRFDQVLSPTPLTLPSHATLFTGTVPRRHGVRDNGRFRLGEEPALLAEQLKRNGYHTAAFVSSIVLDRITGLDRGFDHYDDTVQVGPRAAFNHTERAASQTNAAVLNYLDQLPEPFFLWVHYFDPHLPYVPPSPFRERFASSPYDGELAFVDEQFGLLLRAVEKRSGSLVAAVAGDHGEGLGQFGEQAHGVFLYQATQRVPLIVAGPKVPKGKIVREQVGLVDVAPTLMELLALDGPPATDGRSLVSAIAGGRSGPRRLYELETQFPNSAYGWAPLRGLVVDGYKYIEAPEPELYRLSTDARERENLIAQEPARAARYAKELRALIADDRFSAAEVQVDPELAERRRRLESLGYISGAGGRSPAEAAIDPKQGIRWIADLEAGRRAYQTGNPAQGIAPLTRLLEKNPTNVSALLTLALCQLGVGDAAEAVKTNRRALKLQPDDDRVHLNLANAEIGLAGSDPKALPEAFRHYERALQLNPRFADAYVNFASALERSGEATRALALLQRARATGVLDPAVETQRAVLELKAGNPTEAIAAFRIVLELQPYEADPLEAMAKIHERQNRFAEAAGYYERLLEVRPTARTVERLAAIRLERLGDSAGASRAYRRGLELLPAEDPSRDRLAHLLGALPPAN